MPYQRVQVVPHGSPTGRQVARPRPDPAELGSLTEFKVMAFGYVHENKGHHIAVEALRFLPEAYRLIICGASRLASHRAYRERLEQLVHDHGLQRRVEFMGFVPDGALEAVFSQMSCAVFPYLWPAGWLESSGACIMALAHGVPAVASDTQVFTEMNAAYGCPELCPQGDPEALADAIRRICESPSVTEGLRENAAQFAERTAWPRVAQLTHQTYVGFMVDHPDSLYLGEGQLERLAWLRQESGGQVLEVGCATGRVADEVGASVAVDLRLDRLVHAASAHPRVRFVASDATRLPFSDHRFDVVLLPELLDHLAFDVAVLALREAMRVSRRRVLITFGRAEYDGNQYDSTIGAENREHVWLATRKKVHELVGDAKAMVTSSDDGRFWYICLETEAHAK